MFSLNNEDFFVPPGYAWIGAIGAAALGRSGGGGPSLSNHGFTRFEARRSTEHWRSDQNSGCGDDRFGKGIDRRACRRDPVDDEITAHKTGAMYISEKLIDERVDTIFEIGSEAAGHHWLNVLNTSGEPGIMIVGRPYDIYDKSMNLDSPGRLRDYYGVNVILADSSRWAVWTSVTSMLKGDGWPGAARRQAPARRLLHADGSWSEGGYADLGEHAGEIMRTGWRALVASGVLRKLLLKTGPTG